MCFIPFMAIAADYCTNPKEYTIDKRCYVTDEQKEQTPYNATVGLIENDKPYCTGTIVKGNNEKLYMYTAKHCAQKSKNSAQLLDRIQIKFPNGATFSVYKNIVGDYLPDNKYGHDWAVYNVPDEYGMVAFVNPINRSLIGTSMDYDVKVIGYGLLKIMSDKEISVFKEKYVQFLNNMKEKTAKQREEKEWELQVAQKYDNVMLKSLFSSGGEKFVAELKKTDSTYYHEMFHDTNLKLSECKYNVNNDTLVGCQGWGGNSGGPVFDSKDNIIAVVTTGNYDIGGKEHATLSVVEPINIIVNNIQK